MSEDSYLCFTFRDELGKLRRAEISSRSSSPAIRFFVDGKELEVLPDQQLIAQEAPSED